MILALLLFVGLTIPVTDCQPAGDCSVWLGGTGKPVQFDSRLMLGWQPTSPNFVPLPSCWDSTGPCQITLVQDQTPARTIKLDLTVTPGRVDRFSVTKDGVWTFQGQAPQVGFDHGADSGFYVLPDDPEYKIDTCTPMLWSVLRATIDALSGRMRQSDIAPTLKDAQEACQ